MDDSISRQMAIYAADKIIARDTSGNNDVVQAMIAWKEYVKHLPSAQPERKKGEWINHRNDNGHNIADCSECGSAIQWFDDDEKPKFCCMCGADMRGEQDG